MSDRDSFLREVDEAVRQDRYQQLWDKYGVYALGLAVLVVACVAGYKGWTYWQQKQAQEAGAKFTQALGMEDGADAAKANEMLTALAESGPAGYRSRPAVGRRPCMGTWRRRPHHVVASHRAGAATRGAARSRPMRGDRHTADRVGENGRGGRAAPHHAEVDLTGGRVTVYVIGPWPPGGSALRLTRGVGATRVSGPNLRARHRLTGRAGLTRPSGVGVIKR